MTRPSGPKGCGAGTVRLVGWRRDAIASAVANSGTRPEVYERFAAAINPYGDGRAADRIAAVLGDKYPADNVGSPKRRSRRGLRSDLLEAVRRQTVRERPVSSEHRSATAHLEGHPVRQPAGRALGRRWPTCGAGPRSRWCSPAIAPGSAGPPTAARRPSCWHSGSCRCAGVELFTERGGRWYRLGEHYRPSACRFVTGSTGVPLEQMVIPSKLSVLRPGEQRERPGTRSAGARPRGERMRPATAIRCALDDLAGVGRRSATSAQLAPLQGGAGRSP